MENTQLGFDQLMLETHQTNRQRRAEKEFGYLPSSIDEGLPYFNKLIDEHHAAMVACDIEVVQSLRKKAEALAVRLNGNDPGYRAEGGAGLVLEAATKADAGMTMKWGQCADFLINVEGMNVRIEIDGIFGIGMSAAFWPCFSAHVVDRDKPFISETGYQSFFGIHMAAAPHYTPEKFVACVLLKHLKIHGTTPLTKGK